jgi:hypothetical protein
MQPAAAGGLEPRSELQCRQDIAHELGRRDDLLPQHRGTRIEIPQAGSDARYRQQSNSRCGSRRFPSAREIRPPRSSPRRGTRQPWSSLGFAPAAARSGPALSRASENCTVARCPPGNEPASKACRLRAERSNRRCARSIERAVSSRLRGRGRSLGRGVRSGRRRRSGTNRRMPDRAGWRAWPVQPVSEFVDCRHVLIWLPCAVPKSFLPVSPIPDFAARPA